MAPGAARWPPLIWAPSKAGPVGLDAASSRSALPSTISAFVPTSTMSRTSPLGPVGRLGEDDAGRVGPDVAGDARQDVDPGAGMGGRPSSVARMRTARSVASANGAEPSGIGSMPSTR